MRQPDFAAALVEALRNSPDFYGPVGAEAGHGAADPDFTNAMAESVVSAPPFYPSLAPGYAVGPVGQLFPQDFSHMPPATYSSARGARPGARPSAW